MIELVAMLAAQPSQPALPESPPPAENTAPAADAIAQAERLILTSRFEKAR